MDIISSLYKFYSHKTHIPPGTRRNDNDFITSPTSFWRNEDVIIASLLRHVSVGVVCMSVPLDCPYTTELKAVLEFSTRKTGNVQGWIRNSRWCDSWQVNGSHWGRDKMATIFQTFSDAFSRMKNFVIWSRKQEIVNKLKRHSSVIHMR